MGEVLNKKNFLYNQQAVEKSFAVELEDIIRSSFPKVEKVEGISQEDFVSKYVSQNKPVIIKNYFSANRFNLDYFEQKAGHLPVCINLYDTKNALNADIKTLASTIRSNPKDPTYLQEWLFQKDFPEFLDDFPPPSLFDDDAGQKALGFRPMTIWIGSKDSVTPIHEDTGYFNLCSAQLFGKKEWFFFSKEATLTLDKNGNPDFESFLNDPATQAQSCILEAGDVLFMPYKWWHRTSTLEHSGSFNMPYVTEQTVQKYVQAIFSLPMILALKGEELKKLNRMRYDVTKQRVELFAHLVNFNPEYLINAIKNPTSKDKEALKAA